MPAATAVLDSSSVNREMEDHAVRIRDLEGNYAEVAAQLAAQSVQIDSQSAQLTQLSNAVDRGVTDLAQRIETLATPLLKQVEDHGRQIADMQKVETARADAKRDRLKTVKTWSLGLAAAAAGVLGKEGATWLLTHFHLLTS